MSAKTTMYNTLIKLLLACPERNSFNLFAFTNIRDNLSNIDWSLPHHIKHREMAVIVILLYKLNPVQFS